MASYYFVIVGKNDTPIFECDFGPESAEKKEEQRHNQQFSVHSALDTIDELMWTTSSMNLKVVEKCIASDQLVSAFVTAGNTRFVLLHDTRNDDGIKGFMQDVYDVYVKVLMNPLYSPSSPITSPDFRTRVRAIAKKYL